MLLRTTKAKHVDKWGYEHWHDVHTVQCDTCGKQWETRISKAKLSYSKTHSCSRECKNVANRPGGVAFEARKATCLERFGVENPYMAEACKQKAADTMFMNHGVTHALQSPKLLAKQQATTQERLGVVNAMYSSVVKQRVKDTMIQNWGVEHTWDIPHVREAMMSGSIAKHGVPFPLQNPEVMQTVLDKRYATVQAKGGKAYQSKPEQQFRALLEEQFGTENVLVQQRVNKRWSIDFYVKAIDTYVQFDGAYWHALDRPIEQIAEHSTVRDAIIHKKWLTDREQDAWFHEHGFRLVRITDVEFKADPQACLLKIAGTSGPSLHHAARAELHL